MYTYKERLEMFIKRTQDEIERLNKVINSLTNEEADRKHRLEIQVQNKKYSLGAYQTALIYYKDYVESYNKGVYLWKIV